MSSPKPKFASHMPVSVVSEIMSAITRSATHTRADKNAAVATVPIPGLAKRTFSDNMLSISENDAVNVTLAFQNSEGSAAVDNFLSFIVFFLFFMILS